MSKRCKIIRNSARCHACNQEIVSRHTHDFVTCKCGRLMIDGGLSYLKRIGPALNDKSYDETSVVKD